MAWSVHLEITGGPKEQHAQWDRIRRESLEDLGHFWHEQYLPEHFQPYARGKYGYAPRTQDYQDRKRRIHGHNDPLVFSGSFKHDVLSFAEVRPQGAGVEVVMRSPVLNLVSRAMSDPSYPDIKEEASAVTPDEAERFARKVDMMVTARLKGLSGTTTS